MSDTKQRITSILSHYSIQHNLSDPCGPNCKPHEDVINQLHDLLIDERIDEVGRSAPHQVAQHFSISPSELNSSWYLDYCKYRRDTLTQQKTKETKE